MKPLVERNTVQQIPGDHSGQDGWMNGWMLEFYGILSMQIAAISYMK